MMWLLGRRERLLGTVSNKLAFQQQSSPDPSGDKACIPEHAQGAALPENGPEGGQRESSSNAGLLRAPGCTGVTSALEPGEAPGSAQPGSKRSRLPRPPRLCAASRALR